jgi:ATP-dependent helicase/nuclease subunit A
MTDVRLADAGPRRIVREDLRTNLLVEAGAGSGKTQMLAERMAAGVAAGEYAIEHLAAVTFTRKAAAELRGRFHLALERQLRALEQGPADRPAVASAKAEAEPPRASRDAARRVSAALGNLERFFAGTIHAFCARLLRERPVEAGVAPGFVELDELQDMELRARAWRAFVSHARSGGDADMLALIDADVRPNDLVRGFDTVCLYEDVEFPAGDAAPPDAGRAMAGLDTFWRTLEPHLPPELDPESTCPIQKAARQFTGLYDVSTYRLDRPEVVASLLSPWDCRPEIVQMRWAESPAEKKRLKHLINPLHDRFRTNVVRPFLAAWRHYVYRLAVTVLTRARDYAARERRRVNALNYGDLLILTARVLRENAGVRRALQRKYRHLFVDEFQDTDPVQAEIVFLLAADEPAATGGVSPDWQKVALRPGALFVVGDPKQSIYRFRRADIGVYNIVLGRFADPAVGRALSLTTNFRSVAPLCDWANAVFRARFPARPTEHAPPFVALEPAPAAKADLKAARSEDKDDPGIGVFRVTHAGDRGDVPGRDAERIARFIRAEVDAGQQRYSDFLLLTRRKRSRLVPYVRALEGLNIPVEVSGAGAFGGSGEVASLIALLRVLADPQDQIALVGILRGPLFGVSDRELFAFRQAGGRFTLSADDHGETPVGRALAVLRHYHRWTRMLPAAAALERVLEDNGGLALAATTPGGAAAGDLVHAVDRVRRVVEDGGTLADAADALEDDADESNEVESLPLEPGRADVVRVMNLHKAKGLEAHTVFLADPTGGYGPRVDEHIERDGTVSRGWFKLTGRPSASGYSRPLGEHPDWDAHERAEVPYQQAEEERLLYVAATRARERLVISRWSGNQKWQPWGALHDASASVPELSVPNLPSTPTVAPLDCADATRLAGAAARHASHARARQASWLVTSATEEARHVARMTRSADPAADDPTRVVVTDTPTHRADAGIAWGTLMHGLLEHAMRHGTVTRNDLRRLAMWLTVEEPGLRSSIDDALDTVERVRSSDVWRAARQTRHLEEAPFAVFASGTLTAGVIDLLFDSAEGWRLRDYKTDLTLDPAAYDAQLRTYRTALERLGCRVADAELLHVRTPEPETAR